LPAGTTFLGPPEVIADQIIVTADDNTLNAINLNTRELDWERTLGRSNARGDASAVVCANPICYASGESGTIGTIDIRTQEPLWSASLHSEGRSDEVIRVRPLLVAGDFVYAGTDYANNDEPLLQIFNRHTGDSVRKLQLDESLRSVPVIAGDNILVSTLSSVRAYNKDTYDFVWRTDFDDLDNLFRTSDMALAGDVVVIVAFTQNPSDRQIFVGIDINTSAVLWTQDAGTQDSLYSPQTDGTNIYSNSSEICAAVIVGPCDNGSPIALRADTGEVIWSTE